MSAAAVEKVGMPGKMGREMWEGGGLQAGACQRTRHRVETAPRHEYETYVKRRETHFNLQSAAEKILQRGPGFAVQFKKCHKQPRDGQKATKTKC